MESIVSSIEEVRGRIEKAAVRSGRQASEIILLAVTKVFPAAVLVGAYEAGLREFGENYVQEFAAKSTDLGHLEGARFHLIGHLQSNKSRLASDLFQVIQTVDSVKLARRLDETGRKVEAMIELNLSGEESKSGADPNDLPELVDSIRRCNNLELTGLMTIPEWSEDAEKARPVFARLRELAAKHNLPKLSMGMSHDLEVAIEEGSTMVRVGTALFGRRPKR